MMRVGVVFSLFAVFLVLAEEEISSGVVRAAIDVRTVQELPSTQVLYVDVGVNADAKRSPPRRAFRSIKYDRSTNTSYFYRIGKLRGYGKEKSNDNLNT
jgi:hypothetical protein